MKKTLKLLTLIVLAFVMAILTLSCKKGGEEASSEGSGGDASEGSGKSSDVFDALIYQSGSELIFEYQGEKIESVDKNVQKVYFVDKGTESYT